MSDALREENLKSSEPVMSKRQVAGMQPWLRNTNFFFDTRSTCTLLVVGGEGGKRVMG